MTIEMDSVMKPIKCREKTINPCDLIFGDINGIVIINQNDTKLVLEKIKEIISTDIWWFEQLEEELNYNHFATLDKNQSKLGPWKIKIFQLS